MTVENTLYLKKKLLNYSQQDIFSMIKSKDYLLYIFGIKSTKGSLINELSERITHKSLSCEQLIKNNIYNIKKL